MQISLRRAGIRVLYSHTPWLAVRLCTNGFHIAAKTQECRGHPRFFQFLSQTFRGVALCDSSDIKAHVLIRQINCGRLFINLHLIQIYMLCRSLKFLLARHLRPGWIFDSCLPVVMPDREYTSHGHINFSTCFLIFLSGKLQKPDDLRIYRDRGNPGVVVDGFDVIYTIIIIVNIKQLMIFLHGIFCQMLIFRKLFLTLRADCNAGNGIKIIQILRVIGSQLRTASGTARQ